MTAVGAVGAVLVLGACGSAPSKDTYVSRGDAICKQAAAAQAKLKVPAKGDLTATARYLKSSTDLIDSELSKLRKLAKPSGDGGRLGDLLAREGDAIATLRKASTAAADRRQQEAKTLFDEGQSELSDVGAGLRDYGFNVCGT